MESVLRHPGDNRTQIRELSQTLIDGGILDELISEKLESFNSRYEQLNHQVRTLSFCVYIRIFDICYMFACYRCRNAILAQVLNCNAVILVKFTGEICCLCPSSGSQPANQS